MGPVFDIIEGVLGGLDSAATLASWAHLRRPIHRSHNTLESPPTIDPEIEQWVRRDLRAGFEARGLRRILSGPFKRETHWIDAEGHIFLLMRQPRGRR